MSAMPQAILVGVMMLLLAGGAVSAMFTSILLILAIWSGRCGL